MPILARFYGMIIRMYFQQSEHNPPHVHVQYGEYVGVLDIQTLMLLEGDLPPKALAMVREWVMINKEDLMKIWTTQEFRQLPPLE